MSEDLSNTGKADAAAPGWMGRRRSATQWLLLLLLSLLLAALLEIGGLPAALLIGPMLAGVAVAVGGATIRVPTPFFGSAQAVVGCLVAAALAPDIFQEVAADWPILIGATLSTIAASSAVGYFVSRWGLMPGTTAVWGSAPGGATAMVLMAEAFGADSRLVAFMQYARVIVVSLAAAAIAGIWVEGPAADAGPIQWFPPIDPIALAATAAICCAGMLAGKLLRLTSPFFLGTAILAITVRFGLGVEFQLPPWLLAASYAAIGWTIGLKFSGSIVRQVARAVPQVLASIVVLICFCGAMALLISRFLGIDPLTAYLATSPGGLDTVAIVAAASETVDLSFVMALQGARLLFVLAFGAPIARFIARRLPG